MKKRVISADHTKICFKPCGIRARTLSRISLFEDEMEAIRLADFEGLYQQECADKMGISRTTFSRLIENARLKIADALLNRKAIDIKQQKESKK